MMNPSGRWLATTNDDSYEIEFEPRNEAWLVYKEETQNTLGMKGVGFMHDNSLCVARGIVAQPAELDGTVGLVQYDIQMLGNLPARWYHPSLNGRLSDGLSANGPTNAITGEYQADYEDSNGRAFNSLRKTISKKGSSYDFAWWDEERFLYVGVGQVVNGALFAAWGPPGSIIQFTSYDLGQTTEPIQGKWVDYGRNRFGSETLTRVP